VGVDETGGDVSPLSVKNISRPIFWAVLDGPDLGNFTSGYGDKTVFNDWPIHSVDRSVDDQHKISPS
jgi:hypothetical protein